MIANIKSSKIYRFILRVCFRPSAMQNAKIGNARRPNILWIKISGKSSKPIWSIVIEIRPIIFR